MRSVTPPNHIACGEKHVDFAVPRRLCACEPQGALKIALDIMAIICNEILAVMKLMEASLSSSVYQVTRINEVAIVTDKNCTELSRTNARFFSTLLIFPSLDIKI